MGFWDRDVELGLDELFDYNEDGRLDACEEALEFEYLDKLSRDDSDDDVDEEDAIRDEIECMDRDEAEEYLESEGYDPDDFDLD